MPALENQPERHALARRNAAAVPPAQFPGRPLDAASLNGIYNPKYHGLVEKF
jgi:hypothetical protein